MKILKNAVCAVWKCGPISAFLPIQAPFCRAISSHVLLALDGSPLTIADADRGLFLLDATWRYAAKMRQFVDAQADVEIRSIPAGFRTAYPRRQDDCPEPEEGLASVEALYIAYAILGRDTNGLLDTYHWKKAFLEKNADLL